ncbi:MULTISPECIES: 2-hydroxyacid dehydrogenase [unclassified Roseateles]|jgi:hydroxypyruvate reductase|uniref:2-hydroxyacid dehydrogenase n=1 Tax=unclassified Roseateles TaxID=2626991 RepID=UPI0016074B82|nr:MULTISPECIES: 2-hydroxyacid dehydrogenase [unclassified Roseateles]MBB3292299.1 lactate dehydrogenase-like 2-hydroxyacid dehydrogenase [Mitsuaria sp. BK041]MBB3361517.1 lactate dehydrogenase-like 2-hydroxyacid dehydrogenase [Mitsuaria sp. BK045]
MKPHILQLNPILVPSINARLDELYTMHRLFEQADPDAYIATHGAAMRGVITGGHTGISRSLMERLPALEVVAVNGVGTDAVDLAYARSRGLPVTGTFGALTEDVADMALGLLLATCRHLGAVDRFVRGGLWPKFPQPGALPLARRVSGMRVGIVGLGRVGRAVAERVGAFGCPVRYTDLKEIPGVAWAFEADLVQLARDSDALIVCAAADQARDLIDAAVLDALGPRGFLINVARGRLVKEADLVRALQERRIAGAGLDVFADEPNVPPALLDMDNVMLQAHRASATEETRAAMGQMVLDSLAQALAGERPAHSLTT